MRLDKIALVLIVGHALGTVERTAGMWLCAGMLMLAVLPALIEILRQSSARRLTAYALILVVAFLRADSADARYPRFLRAVERYAPEMTDAMRGHDYSFWLDEALLIVDGSVRYHGRACPTGWVEGLPGRGWGGRFRWIAEGISAECGDRLRICGRIAPLPHANLIGERDSEAFYAGYGLSGTLTVSRFERLCRGSDSIAAVCGRFRGMISDACTAIGSSAGRFLERILLGGSAPGDPDMQNRMRDLGLSHLLAASGLHVGLIYGWGCALLSFSGLRRWCADVLMAAVLIAYAALIGAPPSILRAISFLLYRIGARLSGRRANTLKAFLIAMAITLICHPRAWSNQGFLLSFLCAAALWLVDADARMNPGRAAWVNALRKGLWMNALTLPITFRLSGRFGFVALIANGMAVPVFSKLFAFGGATLILGTVPMLGDGMRSAFRLCYGLLEIMLSGLASLPMLSIRRIGGFDGNELSLYAVLMGIGIYRTLHPSRGSAGGLGLEDAAAFRGALHQVLIRSGALIISAGCIGAWGLPQLRRRLTMLDIGQGDGLMLEYGGRVMLFDTGGKFVPARRAGHSASAPAMPDPGEAYAEGLIRRGIRHIDAVWISHDDYDHVGHLSALAQRIPIDRILHSPVAPGQTLDALNPVIPRAGASHMAVEQGAVHVLPFPLGLSSPASVEVLLAGELRDEERNAGSMVVLLDMGPTVLLTGDIEHGDDAMIAQLGGRQVDVLKAAHHGAEKGTTARLAGALTPGITLISSGLGNRYGHPRPEVLARLRAVGSRILRTDMAGAIVLNPDPFTGQWVCGYEKDLILEEQVFCGWVIFLLGRLIIAHGEALKSRGRRCVLTESTSPMPIRLIS